MRERLLAAARTWGAVAATACAGPVAAEPGFVHEPGFTPVERALVLALFTAVQPRSIAKDIEICGYIYRDEAGHLRATAAEDGETETCMAPWPARGEPLASWHTHGAFNDEMWTEVPSARDLQADNYEGVDGWVATPGGRLWHVDGANMIATLICGPACLPHDPAYEPAASGPVGSRYTLDALLDKFAGE
jgi:hypothetical protein